MLRFKRACCVPAVNALTDAIDDHSRALKAALESEEYQALVAEGGSLQFVDLHQCLCSAGAGFAIGQLNISSGKSHLAITCQAISSLHLDMWKYKSLLSRERLADHIWEQEQDQLPWLKSELAHHQL
eukprot:scaffold46663_cov17-Tisochrysis_lutea.AAC.1